MKSKVVADLGVMLRLYGHTTTQPSSVEEEGLSFSALRLDIGSAEQLKIGNGL